MPGADDPNDTDAQKGMNDGNTNPPAGEGPPLAVQPETRERRASFKRRAEWKILRGGGVVVEERPLLFRTGEVSHWC